MATTFRFRVQQAGLTVAQTWAEDRLKAFMSAVTYLTLFATEGPCILQEWNEARRRYVTVRPDDHAELSDRAADAAASG